MNNLENVNIQEQNLGLPGKNKKKKVGVIIAVALAVAVIIAGAVLFVMNSFVNDYDRQVNLGYNLMDEGKYEEAILAFDKAIEIDDTKPKAYYGKASAMAFDPNMTKEKAIEIAKVLKTGYEKSKDAGLIEHMKEVSEIMENNGFEEEAKVLVQEYDKKKDNVENSDDVKQSIDIMSMSDEELFEAVLPHIYLIMSEYDLWGIDTEDDWYDMYYDPDESEHSPYFDGDLSKIKALKKESIPAESYADDGLAMVLGGGCLLVSQYSSYDELHEYLSNYLDEKYLESLDNWYFDFMGKLYAYRPAAGYYHDELVEDSYSIIEKREDGFFLEIECESRGMEDEIFTMTLPFELRDDRLILVHDYNGPYDEYTDILKGDFSKVAGKYTYPSGEQVTLFSDGQINWVDTQGENEDTTWKAEYFFKHVDGTYSWSIALYEDGEPESVVNCIIWPEGVEVIDDNENVIETDTSRIRMWIGFGDYSSAEDFAYKDAEQKMSIKRM